MLTGFQNALGDFKILAKNSVEDLVGNGNEKLPGAINVVALLIFPIP